MNKHHAMMKAIILEDNPRGLHNLQQMLADHCQEVQVVGAAASIEDGLLLLQSLDQQPDVAFLDIQLQDGLVFHFLEKLGHNIHFEIIFVSGYQKYLKEACKHGSIGYLFKPLDVEELKEAVKRIRPYRKFQASERARLANDILKEGRTAGQPLILPGKESYEFVKPAEILYLQGFDNYTWFYLLDGRKLLICETLKNFVEILEEHHFFRIHKRHLVNIKEVRTFRKTENFLEMTSGDLLVVARRRKASLLTKLRMGFSA